MENNHLYREWALLQNQYDSYEKHSLYIKLVSVISTGYFLSMASLDVYILLILLTLWGLDSIWKTFQSRIEPRLLTIEAACRENKPCTPFQFNSDYAKHSKQGVGKIIEYFKQSMRPTIAFPHVLLILILLFKLTI